MEIGNTLLLAQAYMLIALLAKRGNKSMAHRLRGLIGKALETNNKKITELPNIRLSNKDIRELESVSIKL